MNYTAEQLQSNWDIFIGNIKSYISEPRRKQLLTFYKRHEERLILYPASIKKEYHSAFPGGYVSHVNRVVLASLELYDVWKRLGMDVSTFTIEELIFSAINHDLGKIGDEDDEAYIPQTDKWRREKLGENYMFNSKLSFASVPDRGLFLLQENQIKYSFNEMIGIQTHDGLYDEANKKYYMGWAVEQKFRTCLPFILHQADILAAKIEFEIEWGPKLWGNSKNNLDNGKKAFTLGTKSKQKTNVSVKAMKSIKSSKLNTTLTQMLDNIKEK